MATKKKIQFNRTGAGTEPVWQSRRVWGAALSLLAVIGIVLAPEQYEFITAICAAAAGALGITSWVKPKA